MASPRAFQLQQPTEASPRGAATSSRAATGTSAAEPSWRAGLADKRPHGFAPPGGQSTPPPRRTLSAEQLESELRQLAREVGTTPQALGMDVLPPQTARRGWGSAPFPMGLTKWVDEVRHRLHRVCSPLPSWLRPCVLLAMPQWNSLQPDFTMVTPRQTRPSTIPIQHAADTPTRHGLPQVLRALRRIVLTIPPSQLLESFGKKSR